MAKRNYRPLGGADLPEGKYTAITRTDPTSPLLDLVELNIGSEGNITGIRPVGTSRRGNNSTGPYRGRVRGG